MIAIMEKIHKIAIGVLMVGIILNIIISPVMSIIAGMGLWFLLWFAQGGMAEGNPYKRMGYSRHPDFIEVKDYTEKKEIELRDRGKYNTTIFVFVIGLILVITGIIWINIIGF